MQLLEDLLFPQVPAHLFAVSFLASVVPFALVVVARGISAGCLRHSCSEVLFKYCRHCRRCMFVTIEHRGTKKAEERAEKGRKKGGKKAEKRGGNGKRRKKGREKVGKRPQSS